MGAVVTLILAVIAAAVVIGMVGIVVTLLVGAVVAMVKLVPILLVGYVVVKLIQRTERRQGALRRGDSAWLDVRG
jgi:hypothetical protein